MTRMTGGTRTARTLRGERREKPGTTPLRRVVLATTNPDKLRELREVLAPLAIELVSLTDVGGAPTVVEDGLTFEMNARKKATETARHLHLPVLADDSGLEVDVLEGAPGVHSARFAGEPVSAESNNRKLLALLASVPDAKRSARFRCVLALADARGRVVAVASGSCEGRLARTPRGTNGFGYDPLFVPEGETRTMAELSSEEKHARSHRGRAAAELCGFIIAKSPRF